MHLQIVKFVVVSYTAPYTSKKVQVVFTYKDAVDVC